jgi:hypothetical protein
VARANVPRAAGLPRATVPSRVEERIGREREREREICRRWRIKQRERGRIEKEGK